MRAKDVMTTNVVTISVDGTIEAAANLMLSNRISGLPVVDGSGAVVGVVSEGDLLHRAEIGSERKRSWWLNLFDSAESQAREFLTEHSHKVADVMTRKVMTVTPETELQEIATILEERRIKRLPVVEGDKLVGIVSRANLLQAFASRPVEAPKASSDERSLREAVTKALKAKDWATHGVLNVIVSGGVVELWGWVDSIEERRALCLAAEEVPGVTEVVDHLGSVPPWRQGT